MNLEPTGNTKKRLVIISFLHNILINEAKENSQIENNVTTHDNNYNVLAENGFKDLIYLKVCLFPILLLD